MPLHEPPLYLDHLRPAEARERLRARSFLVLPVGSSSSTAPHLPLGAETRVVEYIARLVALARGLLIAPTLAYGVQPAELARDGGAALRRKTLHCVINELIDSWEVGAGIRHLVLLTAHAGDAHLEALSTVRTERATFCAVDLLSIDVALDGAPDQSEQRRLFILTELMEHIAPELLAQASAPGQRQLEAARHGGRIAEALVERILRLVDANLTEER